MPAETPELISPENNMVNINKEQSIVYRRVKDIIKKTTPEIYGKVRN